MIRKATPADTIDIAAFLDRHIESSMFLLGNLLAHGTEETEHRNGTAFFLRETGEGITGVFGCTNGGFLMCQLPGLTRTEAQTYAHLLRGYWLMGMSGDAQQVATVLEVLPVPQDAWALNRVEPLYRLTLTDALQHDPGLRAPGDGDFDLLKGWFAAYLSDTGQTALAANEQALETRARHAIDSGRTRILEVDGQPAAMVALNASAGPAVQLGGVFVPADLRGNGYAERASAAFLAELRDQGVQTAILFAASDQAAKAYEKIGFERVGDYRVALMPKATQLDTPA